MDGTRNQGFDGDGDRVGVVTNTGNVTLTGVTVTDPLTGQNIPGFTLAPGAEAFFSIAGDGNIEIASGVTLEEGATYRLTLDVTAGKDNPVLSLVKK